MGKFIRDLIEYNGVDSFIDDKCPPLDLNAFKQNNIDLNFCIPKQKPNIEQIIKVWVEVDKVDYRIVKTPIGTSYEGQTLTGYKLLFVGDIKLKIAYVADECEQSVHTAHTIIPYCEYVVLPEEYNSQGAIRPDIYIEDIYVSEVDCRCIYGNITLMTVVSTC